jgi:hypothetical protein
MHDVFGAAREEIGGQWLASITELVLELGLKAGRRRVNSDRIRQ